MPNDFETSARAVMRLRNDPVMQREVAQVRAKAVLTEVTGEAPNYRWNYVGPRIVRNATAALFDLQVISALQPQDLDHYSQAARYFAEIWESLARLEEKTSRETALM